MKTTLLTLALLPLTLIACQEQQNQPQQSQTQPPAPTKTVAATNLSLDTEHSLLSYISTKNKVISENNTLKFSQGNVDPNGKATLTLNLDSLDTSIPIRDQRSKRLMFQTEQYPTAEISGQLPKDLPLGEPVNIDINIKLHGLEKSYQVPITANLVNQQLSITSYQPITVDAKDFKLDSGINQMLKIAKLKSISYQVPVEFKLIFNQNQ